jgi:hypothetical protein
VDLDEQTWDWQVNEGNLYKLTALKRVEVRVFDYLGWDAEHTMSVAAGIVRISQARFPHVDVIVTTFSLTRDKYRERWRIPSSVQS